MKNAQPKIVLLLSNIFNSIRLLWRVALIFICLHEKSISTVTKNGNEHTVQLRNEKTNDAMAVKR